MVCIETTFAVDLLRGINKEAKEKLAILEGNAEEISISTPSVVELIAGSILNPKVENEKDKVIEFISSFIALDLDIDSAIKAGEIGAELIKRGEKIQIEDIMIAAITMQNNETLVTRNKKHFEKIRGLRIEGY